MPPIWMILLGLFGAYALYQSGKTAGAAASTQTPTSSGAATTIQVTTASGQTFSCPVDAGLPQAVIQQIQQFFLTAGQTDATVQTFSQQLASQGYAIAAGGVGSVWQMMQATSAQAAAASGTGGGGTPAITSQQNPLSLIHGGGGGGGGTPATQQAPTLGAEYVNPVTDLPEGVATTPILKS
jgi:hypothetical protein